MGGLELGFGRVVLVVGEVASGACGSPRPEDLPRCEPAEKPLMLGDAYRLKPARHPELEAGEVSAINGFAKDDHRNSRMT